MKRLWTMVASEIDLEVIAILLGLVLVSAGFWSFWRPGALLLPGLVILWLVIPARRPFIHREADPDPARRKR